MEDPHPEQMQKTIDQSTYALIIKQLRDDGMVEAADLVASKSGMFVSACSCV
jgi:hypothetical protein